MPAYAWIEVPEPGSTEVAALPLPKPHEPGAAVEGVFAVELVTQLVGHVVDREGVTVGRVQAGAAAALVLVHAHGGQVGDAAAVPGRTEHDVADVVVLGADQLGEDVGVLVETGCRSRSISAAV